jgi:hypothetical protein
MARTRISVEEIVGKVRRVLRGIRRERGIAPKGKQPVLLSDIVALLVFRPF